MIPERIDADMKQAMKAKDEPVLSTLRMARSSLKNRQIDLHADVLTDEDAEAVLRTMVKQYRDALGDFVASGRQDLADKQRREIEILEAYLPKGLTPEELEVICRRVIAEQGATLKDLGKLIGVVMKEAKGKADGNAVRESLQRLLAA